MAMGKEKCPVCGDEMGKDAKNVKVGGKNLRVCCDECAQKAKANPSKYAGAGA